MDVDDICLSHFEDAYKRLKQHSDIFMETPILRNVEQNLKDSIPAVKSLTMKLETMQYTGSFKARGAAYQFISLSDEDIKQKRILVTMSAGNYGKAFAHVSKAFNLPAVVFMPNCALPERRELIESLGASVTTCRPEELLENVERHQKENNSLFLHPFDDPVLLIGHASAGLELVNQLLQPPDIVIVCCGGGGFLAGVAAGLKLSGWSATKIYGVEPEKAPTMYEALQAGKIMPTLVDTSTIATGLSPPFVGENSFKLARKYVDGIFLVNDEDLRKAMRTLYGVGLVVEPSGAAAFAALQSNKIPNVEDKDVVVFLTGCNVAPKDLMEHMKSYLTKI